MDKYRIVGALLTCLSVLMLALATINLGLSFELISPTAIPVRFNLLLQITGILCSIAAMSQLLEGGWARGTAALFFGIVAMRLMFPNQPLSETYPSTAEGQFAIAAITCVLTFGAMQINQKAQHWWQKKA